MIWAGLFCLTVVLAAGARFPYEYFHGPIGSFSKRISCDGSIDSVGFEILENRSKALFRLQISQKIPSEHQKISENWNTLLIDKSSSVEPVWKEMILAVENAVQSAVEQHSKVLVMLYDTRVRWFLVERSSFEIFRDSLRAMKPEGGTHLELAFQTFLQVLDREEIPSTHLVLVTDGRPTMGSVDYTTLREYGKRLGGRGIRIDAVAYSKSFNFSLLEGLAKVSGGRLISTQGEGLKEALQGAVFLKKLPMIRDLELKFAFSGEDPIDAHHSIRNLQRRASYWSLQKKWHRGDQSWEIPLKHRRLSPLEMELNYLDPLTGEEKNCAARIEFHPAAGSN